MNCGCQHNLEFGWLEPFIATATVIVTFMIVRVIRSDLLLYFTCIFYFIL
jgi:hypothetical protein